MCYTPNDLYVKFVKYDSIAFEKLHNRENAKTDRGHKWDFKLHEVTSINSLEDIKKEFEKYFSYLLKK